MEQPARIDDVVEATHLALRAYIAGMGMDRDAVDDIAQDVYLDFQRTGARHPAEVPVLAWLKGMARNRVYNHVRSCRRGARAREALARLLESAPPPQEEAAPDGRVAALRACLEALDERRRGLVQAIYAEGRPVQELAAGSGTTVGAIHVAIHRVRERLRACIERRLGLAP